MLIACTCGVRNVYKTILFMNVEAPNIDRRYGHNACVIIIWLANLIISHEYKAFEWRLISCKNACLGQNLKLDSAKAIVINKWVKYSNDPLYRWKFSLFPGKRQIL
jgi:hypothetical protein